MKTLYAFGLLAMLAVNGCAHAPSGPPIQPSDDPEMERLRAKQHLEYHRPKRPVTAQEIHDVYGWSPEDCAKLQAHEVWVGMNLDMLHYLYGLPDRVNVSDYGDGKEYQWCWTFSAGDIRCFYDRDGDGKVDAYN